MCREECELLKLVSHVDDLCPLEKMVSCWTRKGKAADGNDERTKAFIIHENGRQKEMCQLQGTEAKSSMKVNSDYRDMPAREVLLTMQNGSSSMIA
jgi:hypothetical protein